MKINNLSELFVRQVRELYDAEALLQTAYERWRQAAAAGELQALFDGHLEEVRKHRSRLEKVGQCINAGVEGEHSKGTEALTREGDALLDDVTSDEARDAALVIIAQRVEHYLIAGYGTARTYAREMACHDAAELLQRTLDEHGRIDQEMTQLAVDVLNLKAADVPIQARGV